MSRGVSHGPVVVLFFSVGKRSFKRLLIELRLNQIMRSRPAIIAKSTVMFSIKESLGFHSTQCRDIFRKSTESEFYDNSDDLHTGA
jgi:hypothetical protein